MASVTQSLPRIGLGISAATLVFAFSPIKTALTRTVTGYSDISGWIIVAGFVALLLAAFRDYLNPVVRFAWGCFFQPLGKAANQQARLNRFYESQAESERDLLFSPLLFGQ